MKSYLFYFISIVLSLGSCQPQLSKECITAKVITIEFKPPYNFNKGDTLFIDEFKFAHSSHIDSVKNGYYLPKDTLILMEVGSKQAKSTTNNIDLARVLGKKLRETEEYEMLNIPEILTMGKLKIQRLDGKKITACSNESYPAVLDSLK